MIPLMIGAMLIGFAPIFVKLVSTGPTTTGFYRCAFAATILAVLILTKRLGASAPFTPHRWPAKALKLSLVAGVLFAFDLFVWHRSIIFVGAGMATIFANTQVFYSALAGILFFNEKVTPRLLGAIVMAFVGIFLLVSYRLSPMVGANYWWGVGFGLATGIVYASYIVSMRQIEALGIGIPTEHIICVVSAISACTLLPISLFEGTLRLPTGIEWLWLPSLALVAQIVGWVFITRNLPKVPVSRASLILILQPVVAVVCGSILFREQLSTLQLVGAAITLVSIYAGTMRKKRMLIVQT